MNKEDFRVFIYYQYVSVCSKSEFLLFQRNLQTQWRHRFCTSRIFADNQRTTDKDTARWRLRHSVFFRKFPYNRYWRFVFFGMLRDLIKHYPTKGRKEQDNSLQIRPFQIPHPCSSGRSIVRSTFGTESLEQPTDETSRSFLSSPCLEPYSASTAFSRLGREKKTSHKPMTGEQGACADYGVWRLVKELWTRWDEWQGGRRCTGASRHAFRTYSPAPYRISHFNVVSLVNNSMISCLLMLNGAFVIEEIFQHHFNLAPNLRVPFFWLRITCRLVFSYQIHEEAYLLYIRSI